MAATVEKPLVVIVGPTASGKTSLAVELAKKLNGEIICADSRTVYKDMDIGTAKPTAAEQAEVPHWGLDLATPGQRFTAADFKDYAVHKIAEIRQRNKTPFLVGGTGLYVDSVMFDYEFGSDVSITQREKLEEMTLTELHEYCIKNNTNLPENHLNKRYVIRAIERKSTSEKSNSQLLANTIVVGIATDTKTLRTRIADRTEQLFANGVVQEAIMLGKKYGWNNEAMTGNIYPLLHQHLLENVSLEITKQKFTTLDIRLAKRQMTWFRRNPHIEWCSLAEAEQYVSNHLVP